MALLSGVSTFRQVQEQVYRYGYERMPYTALDPALATGLESLITIQNAGKDTNYQGMAIVSDLAVTPTATVNLVLQGEASSRVLPTLGWNTGLEPALTAPDGGLRSTGKVSLQWQNNTGAALTTAQQLTFHGAVKRLTTADKVVQGLYQQAPWWTATDERLYGQYPQIAQGLRPLSIDEMLTAIFRRAIVDEVVQTWTFDANQALPAAQFGPYSVDTGYVYVWHSAAASFPSGSVGHGVILTAQRDTTQTLLEVFLDNATLQYPWRPWVIAEDSLGWSAAPLGATATNGVTVRLAWYKVQITPLLQAWLNPQASGVDPHLADKVMAGVYA